jgi:hypothetical protein
MQVTLYEDVIINDLDMYVCFKPAEMEDEGPLMTSSKNCSGTITLSDDPDEVPIEGRVECSETGMSGEVTGLLPFCIVEGWTPLFSSLDCPKCRHLAGCLGIPGERVYR